MWIKKIKQLVIPLGIILLAIAIFVFMKSTKPEQPPVQVQEKVWMVETLEARFEKLSPVQRLYGQVESNSLVSASAPVAAVVEQVWVKEGDAVKAGDKLVSLDLQDLEIPVQQARAEVADMQAQLRLERLAYQANLERLAHEKKVLEFKRSDVKRTERLLKKDLTSLTVLEQAKEALAKQEYVVVGAELAVEEHKLKSQQNQARLQKAQAVLAQAELNRQRGLVVAPYDGRVSAVPVSAGDRVNAGASLVQYYGLQSLELRAKLPVNEFESVYSRLKKGDAVEAFYSKDAFAEAVPLKLERIAGQASTSGVDVFFSVPSSLKGVRPGDLLEVELQGATYDQAVSVPYSALYGSDRIYLVEDGRLKAQTVKVLGDLSKNGALWALIAPSFAEGAKISVTHLPNAISGLKVTEVSQ